MYRGEALIGVSAGLLKALDGLTVVRAGQAAQGHRVGGWTDGRMASRWPRK